MDPQPRPARRPVGRTRTLVATLVATAATSLAAAPAVRAQDPGEWLLTGASSVPASYWQGLTSSPDESTLFFTGFAEGLWQTTPRLSQTAGVATAIPPAVKLAEGYNHIGDPTWNSGDGGRVILPLECFTSGVGNFCGTGSFGVADPATLAWRYYVKLDPAQIKKAMWAETSPDGSLIWTSDGDDLLAYRSSEVTAANAAPNGPLLEPVRRLVGAVPPSGVTGAVFDHRRLLLAGANGNTFQVWSVNTSTGAGELVLEQHALRRGGGPRHHPDARRRAPLGDRAVPARLHADLRARRRAAPLHPETEARAVRGRGRKGQRADRSRPGRGHRVRQRGR